MKVVNKLCVKLFYCTKIFHWLKYIIFENMNIVGLQYKLLLLTHPCFPHPEAVFSYSIFSTTSFFSHITVCDRSERWPFWIQPGQCVSFFRVSFFFQWRVKDLDKQKQVILLVSRKRTRESGKTEKETYP